MGLLDAFVQYVKDAMPGGLLNAEIPPYLEKVGNNIVAGHKRRDAAMKGLLADPMNTELQGQVVRNGLDLASIAPIGMTAWHGSPHKFDKFSLDKIGTGEGAQAYGHGLYLAESPDVAKSYQNAGLFGSPQSYDDSGFYRMFDRYIPKMDEAMKDDALWKFREDKTPELITAYQNIQKGMSKEQEHSKAVRKAMDIIKDDPPTNLYKVDIPDESVARFLDWDKPVSEAMRKHVSEAAMKQWESGLSGTSGEHLYNEVVKNFEWAGSKSPKDDAIKWLNQQGIPGIRYLDGGSRSAGQGSSNFVIFDPEMIRILERNGQPTGLQPWAPGEYGGLLK